MARILVVEDNAELRSALTALLCDEGYQVVAVADGPEALRAAEAEAFDLVITDFAMPGMDGAQLVMALSELSAAVTPPVIVYSGSPPTASLQQVIDSSQVHYVHKSERADVLLERVRLLLRPQSTS